MLVFFTLLVLAHSVCSDACVFRGEIITLRFVSILISLLLFLLHELCKYSCVCSICFLLSFVVCFCMLCFFCYWPTCFGLSTLLNKTNWIQALPFSAPVIFNPKFRILLNPVTWEKVFLEMVRVIQLAKKLPAFYEIQGWTSLNLF